MKFSLRSLYLYAVCLIMLVTTLFAVVALGTHIVDLVSAVPFPGDPDPGAGKEFAEHQAVLGIIRNGLLLILTVPLFVYHWRTAQRENRPPISRD